MEYDVFISYSSRDASDADAICSFLESRGIKCWIAPRNIMPGVEYSSAIIDAMNQCLVFIIVFTESSNRSQQVAREVERAVSKGLHIIPFRLEACELSKDLEYFISLCQWVNAANQPLESYYKILAYRVTQILAKRRRIIVQTAASGPGASGPGASDGPAAETVAAKKERSRKRPCLVGQNDSYMGRVLFLRDGENVLGRSRSKCDFSFPDVSYISATHALITVSEGCVRVKDLGSRNGTYVNGLKITEAELSEGNIVALEKIRFRLEFRERKE